MQADRRAAHGREHIPTMSNDIIRAAHEGRPERAGTPPATPAQRARISTGSSRAAAAGRVPLHAPLAQARRQGNPAQEPEPHLLPDQRRRPRGGARRRRPDAETRIRLVLSVLPRSRAVPAARHDAARHAARRRRRQGRPEFRRPADAVALGQHEALNIVSGSSPTGTQVLHAVGAAEAGVIYSRVPAIPDRDARFKSDEVIYVSLGEGATSEGEFWEVAQRRVHQEPARSVSRRGQRLRDFRSGRSADARRRHLAPRPIVPRPPRRLDRRHRLSSPACAPCARPPRTFARAAGRRSCTRACIRPYSHSLSDDEKLYKTPAEREAEARRDPIAQFAEFLIANGVATDDDLAAMAAESTRK